MRPFFGAALVFLGMSSAVASENELVIGQSSQDLNVLTLAIDGNDNSLDVRQDHFGDVGNANEVAIRISGDRNGGRRDTAASVSQTPLIDGLPFGSVLQSGHGNAMRVAVTGSDNLFAFAQSGSGNSLSAVIEGQGNQAAVSQVGAGNVAGFSQVGNGNMVSISQRSW